MDKKDLAIYALDVARLEGEIGAVPQPEPEYHALGDRRRFDWAWPKYHLLVEVHGGVWIQGRHTRGSSFIGDRRKMNDAVIMGYRVLEYPVGTIEEDPIKCAREIALALRLGGWDGEIKDHGSAHPGPVRQLPKQPVRPG
jgi:hypothetical protein